MAGHTQRTVSKTRKKVQPTRARGLFDRQIDAVWGSLGHHCREFADGYNLELGTPELIVLCRPDAIVVTMADGGQLNLQLDRAHRAVSGLVASGCAKGICSFESPPLGFTVHGRQLRFAYAAREISEEDLAVRLLTQLTSEPEAG